MSQYLDQVGTFACVVVKPTSGWFGESKEKGTPFLRIPLQVEDEKSEQNSATITCERYITDNTIDRLVKDLMDVFVWDGDLASLETSGEQVPEGFTGRRCSIVTESETFDGKPYYKVKWLNSADYKPQQMAAEKVSSLLAKFGARAKAVAKAAGAVAAPAGKDGVPF